MLDNKIILAALCDYAPQFFRPEAADAPVIDPDEVLTLHVSPPETLPSVAASIPVSSAQIPEDWVIKSPNLSGGKGVYILKTLSQSRAASEIIGKARSNPKDYAYQKLVRIGRIPVAKKDKAHAYHFANIAADIRMWAFYGVGNSTPAAPDPQRPDPHGPRREGRAELDRQHLQGRRLR